MPYTLPNIDKKTCTPVYVVMHYSEYIDTPSPMSADGYNIARSVYVTPTLANALTEAGKFFAYRMPTMRLVAEVKSHASLRDWQETLVGDNVWELVLREEPTEPTSPTMPATHVQMEDLVVKEMPVVGRELV
ncbi:uncharacterized protein LTR77_009283 [Saxophila tyrrhenica]|uniref:Uncharacterized protein n=1 Tax=Saxophila tyrrhenica TaxID=1690608 RepID=A0AAV9P1I9_9PEZI|nr:hypothetical protein LTR77_009283 [Saxophila tyrrhenica]